MLGPGWLGSVAATDRSSPVLRSSSKAPNRTRREEMVDIGPHTKQNKNCSNATRNCRNKMHRGWLLISQRINNFHRFHSDFIAKSPLFHLHLFALCSKQASTGGIDRSILSSRRARGPDVPGTPIPLDLQQLARSREGRFHRPTDSATL